MNNTVAHIYICVLFVLWISADSWSTNVNVSDIYLSPHSLTWDVSYTLLVLSNVLGELLVSSQDLFYATKDLTVAVKAFLSFVDDAL